MNLKLILFDGVCNFCNFWVNFIIDHDSKKYFKFASLQSNLAQNILKAENINPMKIDTIILIINEKTFTKSSAALQIAKNLDGFWKIIYVLVLIPKPIRDLIYDFIARNRYKWFGRRESCRIPTDEERDRFLAG
jgi:predicted DCC family thiol-disulfide oxidoreductase YuxK